MGVQRFRSLVVRGFRGAGAGRLGFGLMVN